ncbi:MAG TPA: dihydrodipicolinate reductase C-terminal domain-containing protein [Bdellovibrionales bacterium]|nr:dihydrodipicolinate reductase C-terminal domain-containing protein [Bdellovibrionales bacterium]
MIDSAAIIGVSGRMGQELLALAPEFDFKVTSGLARGTKAINGVSVVDDLSKLDSKVKVVIDFSLPELTSDVAEWCQANKVPLVSGVTGISPEHKMLLGEVAESIPVLWSPNMSLGIAVVGKMLAQFAALEGFDFQIEEFHHTKKKDKPSGTALLLQKKLVEAVGDDLPEPIAVRGGGIFGIHRVFAMGEEEMVTIEHTAMNRRVFARGAWRAARWIVGRKPGLYRLEDVLVSKS